MAACMDGVEVRFVQQRQKNPGYPSTAPPSGGQQSIDDMELEWQDDEFPRPLPEETTPEEDQDLKEDDLSAGPPSTLDLCGNRHVKRRLSAPDISFNLENSQESAASSEKRDQTTDEDLDFNVDDLETPTSSELLEFPNMSQEFEWDDDLPKAKGTGEASYVETLVTDIEDQSGRKWRIFLMGEHKVDMTAIEPYKKIVSHGGYYGDSLNSIVVFATCYLPESSIPDYQYVMDNLFRYIIGTLDLMVADDYMLIYLNGCTPRSKIPPIAWIKRCYQATGRRLKKNMKSVLIVHPTWYVRALLAIVRPFISAKFVKKVTFVKNLTGLSELVSLDGLHIPDCIQQLDVELQR